MHLCDSNETDMWIRMQVPLELLVPWDINTSPNQCVFHNVSLSTVKWVSCRNIILAPLMSDQLKSSLISTRSAKPLALKDTILILVYINHYKYYLIYGPFAQKNIYTITFGYTQVIDTHTHTHTSHTPILCAMASNPLHHTTCDLYQCFDHGSFVSQPYCYFTSRRAISLIFNHLLCLWQVLWSTHWLWVNTLRPRQNGRHFADDSLKGIFLNENVRISIKNSLTFVSRGPINNIPALVQIMAWRRPGDEPLSEPMMVRLPTHICVTRPQWVKSLNFAKRYFLYSSTRMKLFVFGFKPQWNQSLGVQLRTIFDGFTTRAWWQICNKLFSKPMNTFSTTSVIQSQWVDSRLLEHGDNIGWQHFHHWYRSRVFGICGGCHSYLMIKGKLKWISGNEDINWHIDTYTNNNLKSRPFEHLLHTYRLTYWNRGKVVDTKQMAPSNIFIWRDNQFPTCWIVLRIIKYIFTVWIPSRV